MVKIEKMNKNIEKKNNEIGEKKST